MATHRSICKGYIVLCSDLKETGYPYHNQDDAEAHAVWLKKKCRRPSCNGDHWVRIKAFTCPGMEEPTSTPKAGKKTAASAPRTKSVSMAKDKDKESYPKARKPKSLEEEYLALVLQRTSTNTRLNDMAHDYRGSRDVKRAAYLALHSKIDPAEEIMAFAYVATHLTRSHQTRTRLLALDLVEAFLCDDFSRTPKNLAKTATIEDHTRFKVAARLAHQIMDRISIPIEEVGASLRIARTMLASID